jgi:hypothetical protein
MGQKKQPSQPKKIKRNVYSVKSDIQALDELFSEFIRKRAIRRSGGCEYCGSQVIDRQKENGDTLPAWRQLQCSHFIGRGNHKVRWDEMNAFGSCGGCHLKMEHDPVSHVEFFKKTYGETEYELLTARAQMRGKVDKPGLILYYREKLKWH